MVVLNIEEYFLIGDVFIMNLDFLLSGVILSDCLSSVMWCCVR